MKVLSILLGLILYNSITNAQTTYTRDDAGLQGNAGATSGFFETQFPTNYPAGATSFWHLLDIRHSNPTNNYAMQIAGSFYDQNFWVRKTSDNAQMPWRKLVMEYEGMVELEKLRVINGSYLDVSSQASPGMVIEARTPGRFSNMGAQLEFVVPANLDGGNLWAQGRIITVPGNENNSDATGKMVLGTKRMFSKNGLPASWYFGDDLVINGNGNIGIGTLNPQYPLHVTGKTKLESNVKIIAKDEAWAEGIVVVKPQGWGGLRIARNDPATSIFEGNWAVGYTNYSGNDLSFANHHGGQYNNILHLSATTQNVGIGTATPNEKLAVNGKIRAKEIKVEVANWPDYVFEDDHQLTSLSELEKYILTNKHLPEVPTAKEVTANGVELGEMNKILLKKVEELTLLLIEQNKKFNSEITELKNKVDHLSKSKL